MNNLTNQAVSRINKRPEWAISHNGMINMLSNQPPCETIKINNAKEHETASNKDKTKHLRDYFSLFYNQREDLTISNRVAVTSVYGVLIQDGSPLDLALGMSGYEEIIEDLRAASSDSAIKAVVLKIDSPGGMVSGLKEVCDEVERVKEVKPCVAYVTAQCCSAAYKIASTCSAIIVSPSASVGNIGTVLSWYDISEYLKNLGVSQHVITNDDADLKSTFRESPMSEHQRQFLQDRINKMGAQFWKHVSSNRPQISEVCKRAGWYSPDEAGELGLIDGVGTLEEVIKNLS